MNALDVMKYGHLTIMRTLDGLPDEAWETPAAGIWTVKDIVAHLAVYEQMVGEVLTGFLDGSPMKLRDRMAALGGDAFNEQEVLTRRSMTPRQVLDEYTETQAHNMALLAQIPPERLSEVGTLPWYGAEYALDDYLVYTIYGHKREHAAHIGLVKDRLGER